MNEDTIRINEFLNRMRPQSVSYRDLIGQSDNSTTTPTGQIGEYKSSSVLVGSAISLTTNTTTNITSISLSAGDWDVYGIGIFAGDVLTTVDQLQASITETSATLDTAPGRIGAVIGAGATLFNFGGAAFVNIGVVRKILSATTTIYLVEKPTFAVSTCTGYGIIQARRARHYPG